MDSTMIDDLVEALNFYSEPDNYWSDPLSLDENYDQKTLRACRDAEKKNKVLVDRGVTARDALRSFHKKLTGEDLVFESRGMKIK